MKNTILITFGFALYYLGFKHFENVMVVLDRAINYRLGSYILTYVLIGLPVFITTCIVNRDYDFLSHLGLRANLPTALGAGLIFSLPMFAGGFLQFRMIDSVSVPDLIAKTLLAGFFEELYFRGYFFGQLFQKTRLGFIPSILFCSLVFASGHLYQSQDISIMAGVFMTTFLGSLLFAWLYVEWNYNLWVPIILHTLMNLAWYVFAVSDNALGNLNSNIFRGLTIALSIVLTLMYKKRKGRRISVNRDTLLLKKN